MEAIINMRNFLKFINSMALSLGNQRRFGEGVKHEVQDEKILKDGEVMVDRDLVLTLL